MQAVNAVVLVPIKAFGEAKLRLAPRLTATQRADLARWTASRVLAAAGELPCAVACDDDEVASWAAGHGAMVLWQPGVGLNPAVTDGIKRLAADGASTVIVAHGDLPCATSLAELAHPSVITIVPDRHRDGTNVMTVPANVALPISYGPGSFRRHWRAAVATGAPVDVRFHRGLSLDIDEPADLDHPLIQDVLPPWLTPTNPANRR